MTYTPTPQNTTTNTILNSTVIVAALGYFVDIYDLILFSIIRLKSLKDIGITNEQALTNIGLNLLNWQMVGMLVGGLLWGIIGDRKGRLSVLYGSIIMYSVANILNGMVHNVTEYQILRFIAGVGLAGELGAGITLVSEAMSKEKRGYGTTVVATVGILGAVFAWVINQIVDWRTAYYIGGVLGLSLLLLRISVRESGMFAQIKQESVKKGNFFMLFQNRERFVKYLNCILVGLPTWFVVGILVTLSPEFGKALGVQGSVNAGQAVMWCYVGLAIGDLISGVVSQTLKSRKKAMLIFHILSVVSVLFYLFSATNTILSVFYFKIFLLGLGVGYWAMFVTMASEQFGTNIRATVTTTVPNFARGALVPITFVFQSLKTSFGIVQGALFVGIACSAIALISLYLTRETFGKNLDYTEE